MGRLLNDNDVLDALHGFFDGMLETDTWSPCDLYSIIENLPSAQPEFAKDTVSRQAAISEVHKNYDVILDFTSDGKTVATSVEDILNDLPSVQPETDWETCFDCPLSHGCPKINGCTNDEAMEYASDIPEGCPISAQPEQDWVPCSVINQCYIPELSHIDYKGILFTYETKTGKRFVKITWIERGRIVGKQMNGTPIAYRILPEPYCMEGSE